MDEGDRPTDADESAGRNGSAGDETGGDRAESDPVADDATDSDPVERDRAASDPSEGDATGGDPVERDGPAEPEPDDRPSEPGGTDAESGATAEPASSAGESRATERSAGTPDAGESAGGESLIRRFRHDRDGALMWIREMLSSVAVVLLVGLLLFGVSGVWPPMVAVESGSMEPNMQVGDLVFVTEPGRLAPDAAENGVGVVTHEVGQEVDYRTFGSYGSVMIYTPPGRTGAPIIHRAMFRVTEGENWYDRADAEYHNAVDCGSLANCPAPHDGYITLGDNNGAYDQASGLSPPVRAEWVNGVARLRVPYLGYIRLIATGQVELNEAISGAVGNALPAAKSGLVSSASAA